ncbi:SRPBCC domain-containing protein [Streptosporangiaceae bacterium NEAU-GS5]|nr:SRPBCC domain-containing protein [Streptosporangiaceae bacterium NEAU-GS5]
MNKMFYRGPSLLALHADYATRSRIDEASPVTSSSTVIVEAPASRVWAVIADPRGWARWAPGHEILELGEVEPGAPFTWRLGRTKIRSTFAVVAPERELTWTGVVFGYRAVDQHLLEPLADGRTKVTIRESLSGPFASVLYGPAKLRAGHDAYLAALKAEVAR